MSYREFFEELTDFQPYGFQQDLGLRILAGESLVFRAPTGAGKTWTTVAPFLFSLQKGDRLADRLIYALPLRSLASSLHATVFEALGKLGPVKGSAKDRAYPGNTTYCSLQMGGEKNDPFFEGDLIFCTIDQVLSGYLMMPLSLPERLANIVAGALPGSLLILDEVHLLESGVALGTVIEMLRRFRGAVQFVFMTATMSDRSMKWLAGKLGATAPELPEEEIRELPVQKTKKRVWKWRGTQLDAEAVIAAHQGGRTLAIVNQVGRAQDLFAALREKLEGSSARLACLHSRFFPDDRQVTENRLQSWFGKHASETDVILVTTQVVEAGMDLSADQILTELAPMNALVQRAGRTARYVERPEGSVTVFEVEKYLPYDDGGGEVSRTRECLERLDEEGEPVDFQREQEWVEAVHSEAEKADLAGYENPYERRSKVEDAIRTGDRGRLSELVRDIDSVNILLTSDPDRVDFSGGRWPRMLSVARSSVWKLGEAIQRGASDIWRAESPEDESSPVIFDWKPVRAKGELGGCWFLAVGPESAEYSELSGLRLGKRGAEAPVRHVEQPPITRYRYVYESWVEHVSRVMDQAKAMAFANSAGAKKLDNLLALASGTTENLVWLSVILHDICKLNKKWQGEAWKWETAKTGRPRSEAIAHTTKDAGERGSKMPPHAVEGAFASARFLGELFPDAALAVSSAIARHHSARAREPELFELIPEAEDLVSYIAGQRINLLNCRSRLDSREFSSFLESMWEEDTRKWWPVYAYLARRLRLADQAGTAAGVREAGQRL